VQSIDEGLTILTGADGDANKVNQAVADRLRELALGLKEFTAGSKEIDSDSKP
jgi:hypothetical protein